MSFTYQIKITFKTLEQLTHFLIDKNILADTNDGVDIIQPKQKNPNEKRGSKTYLLHQRAKDYKLINPTIPYKQCLKNIGKYNNI